MSQENVEIVRRLIREIWGGKTGQPDLASWVHPQVEIITSEDFPEQAVLHGLPGFEWWTRRWSELFVNYDLQPERFWEADDRAWSRCTSGEPLHAVESRSTITTRRSGRSSTGSSAESRFSGTKRKPSKPPGCGSSSTLRPLAAGFFSRAGDSAVPDPPPFTMVWVPPGRAAPTIRLVHAVCHRAFRDAVRWDRITRNPAESADPPRRARQRTEAWTATELARFLEHVRDDRLYALWRLAATTGMRRGELAGLTWRSLDLDGSRLEVSQQLVPTRGGVSFGPPKSARSRRTIALDSETVDALRRHRETQQLERDFALDAYQDRDLVFCDALGGPIHPQRLTEWFRAHRKAAGVPTGTLHVLRHTAATIALTNGVPVHIVAARLGDTPATLLSTYSTCCPGPTR